MKNWHIGKDPDAGKEWGQEKKGATEDEIVDGIAGLMDMNLGKLRELVMDREAWRAAVHGVSKSQTQLSDWIELEDEWELVGCVSSGVGYPVEGMNLDMRKDPEARRSFTKHLNVA